MSESYLPLVSIITPVYNGAQYIEELIQSVLSQGYTCLEHIVIDDGSTDATVEILKQYPHLRWWTRGNKGQYATMNEGLEAAKGEVVCFISADDRVASGAILQVIEVIKAHPDCEGVYGFTNFMHEDGKLYLPVTPFRRSSLKFYSYLWHVSHCSLYVKKNFLVKNGLFFDATLRYVGDYDWIIRLINIGIKTEMLPETLSWVRVHESQTSVQQRGKMKLERESIAKKNGINPVFYLFTLVATTWIFNFYKLFFTIKLNGLKGSNKLIKNWLQKRGYIKVEL
jgi:glycosyltransferase involved in cell wall biosynthesis